mgnify:CR=1 FL=1
MKKLLGIIKRHKVESVGLVGAFLVVILGIFGPWFAPYSPTEVHWGDKYSPPSTKHFFGTDRVGRDIFSRVLAGARISLIGAGWVLLAALLIGGTIGISAGLIGGVFDNIIMRLADIFLSFPPLILAIAISASLGAGLNAAIISLAITWWPGYSRVFRSQVLSTKNEVYVEAAEAVGASRWRIIFKHIVLNSIDPIIVNATLNVGRIILSLASLGFIGVGAQPPSPEWGAMVAAGRDQLMSNWWVFFLPGISIFITVLSFTLCGDILRSEMDPELWQKK